MPNQIGISSIGVKYEQAHNKMEAFWVLIINKAPYSNDTTLLLFVPMVKEE